MKLVLIEWIDSFQSVRWTTADPPTEPLLCRSVGWLTHDGKDVKTIAPHMTDEDLPQRAGEMTIPTVCIRKIKRLS